MLGLAIVITIVGAVVAVIVIQRQTAIAETTDVPRGEQTPRRATAADAHPEDAMEDYPPPRWLGHGDVLQLKGFEIASPMAYVSFGRGPAQDPSEITRSLPVAVATEAEDLPYWPWYSHLSPEQRYIYLSWLASGRTSLPPNDGYLFIYYYGLERRGLIDDADHKLVFAEVQRLRNVYTKHGTRRTRNSFMNYSSAFLWFLAAFKPELIKPRRVEVLARRTRVWSEDKLAAALAWFAQRRQPLPPWMAYVVAQESTYSQRSVVVKRVNDEFRALFAKRYAEQFGTGMELRVSKRDRRIAYQPATAVIARVAIKAPNVLGIPSQFKRLSAIWNDCIEDLRKLSSVTRDREQGALTAAAWEAMPAELRESVDHPYTQAICDLIAANTDEDGHVFMRAGELARITKLESRPRLTPTQSRQVAATAEHIGFAVEPDARLTGKGYKTDDLLAVFPQAYEGQPDSRRYGGAACMLQLGLAVAEADGRIDDAELSHITEHIEDGFDLNDHERRRLEALRTLLLQTGANVIGLGKRLQAVLSEQARTSVGRLLVAVAAADGVVSTGELKALRRCYRALGLKPEVLEALLQELAPTSDDSPVSVLPARARRVGEIIPRPREADAAVRLDREAIAQIMHETRQVSALLADAMNIDGDQEPATPVAVAQPPEAASMPREPVKPDEPATTDTTAAPTSATLAPPRRFAAFCEELVTRSQWDSDEAEALARRHGHMLAGAIEDINDWSFQALDGQLVYDDGDRIEIDRDLLGQSG